jgi:hypothetical protein
MSRCALHGLNCNPVSATSEVSPRWASVVMMAFDFGGGAPPGSAQKKWLSPFVRSQHCLRRYYGAL